MTSCFCIIIRLCHHVRRRLTFQTTGGHETSAGLWIQRVARFTALLIHSRLRHSAVNLPHHQNIFIRDRHHAAVQNTPDRSFWAGATDGLLRSLKVLVTSPPPTLIKDAESSSWGSDGELTQDRFIKTSWWRSLGCTKEDLLRPLDFNGQWSEGHRINQSKGQIFELRCQQKIWKPSSARSRKNKCKIYGKVWYSVIFESK